MAIATVTQITGLDPAIREKGASFVHSLADTTRALDGCESFMSLVDGTDSLVVIIWRDQASLEAYMKDRDKNLQAVQQHLGDAKIPMASAPRVFEVDYWK